MEESRNTKVIGYDAITMEHIEAGTDLSLSSYKCGEIFLQQTHQVIFFVCTRCEKHFEYFNAFCSHLDEHTFIPDIIESESKEGKISQHEEEDLVEFRLQDYSVDTDSFSLNVSPGTISKGIETEERSEYEEGGLFDFRLEDGSYTMDTDAPDLSSGTLKEMGIETGEFPYNVGENVIVLRLQDDCEYTDILNSNRMDHGDEQVKLIEISLLNKSAEMDASTPQAEIPCTTAHSHQTSENANSKYDCKNCALQFNLAKDLAQHKCSALKNTSTTKQSIYPCTLCGKVFKSKWNLRTHTYSHTKNKPFKCDRCPATFSNKQNLTVHQRRHNGDKPFSCDHCSWSFASSTQRISHMRTHTGEKPYVCEECGYGHSTSSQLLEHNRRVHLNVRNFECLACGKAFRTSSHFRAHHEAVHQDLPRNHICTVCKAAFKTAAALQAHSKIHKEKSYKCKICNKAFAQHPGLYMHMITHRNMEATSKSTS